jgi:hypothetical protein
MAGCNCKGSISMQEKNDGEQTFFTNFVKYSLKIILFVLFLIAVPIISLYTIYLGFNIIVLNENVDIKPLLKKIGEHFKENKNDEDDYIDEDEFNNLTEDDVILLGAEDITDMQTKN